MSSYRFNIIDDDGIVSFLGPRHGSKMIAAACGANHRSLHGVLSYVEALDEQWALDIQRGLAQHDAARPRNEVSAANLELESADASWQQPFRVVDAASRQASMNPASLGLLVINLKEQRIVEVYNRSIGLQRSDRGRVRRNGKPTRMLFRYKLPSDWAIVP